MVCRRVSCSDKLSRNSRVDVVTLLHRLAPFFEAFFLEALPPASSAFSVLLALCFLCSTLLSALVSYLTFFPFEEFLVARASFVVVGAGSAGQLSCGVEGDGPWIMESGSKSSTTVTVARTSSS
jgi:hypothetical protein